MKTRPIITGVEITNIRLEEVLGIIEKLTVSLIPEYACELLKELIFGGVTAHGTTIFPNGLQLSQTWSTPNAVYLHYPDLQCNLKRIEEEYPTRVSCKLSVSETFDVSRLEKLLRPYAEDVSLITKTGTVIGYSSHFIGRRSMLESVGFWWCSFFKSQQVSENTRPRAT